MLQLNHSGIICDEPVDIRRSEFQCLHTVRFRGLISPELMLTLHRRCEQGHWVEKVHHKIGREVILDDPLALNLLHFVANSPKFLSLVQEITGYSEITRYQGRVYR